MVINGYVVAWGYPKGRPHRPIMQRCLHAPLMVIESSHWQSAEKQKVFEKWFNVMLHDKIMVKR